MTLRRLLLGVSAEHALEWFAWPVVAMLILSGCSESYRGERLFWKAQHATETITKDPAKATPEQAKQVLEAYRRVAEQVPGTMWGGRAMFSIGAFQGAREEYDDARKTFTSVLQDYNQYPPLCLRARIAIAKIYEAEHNWDEAVKMYRELADQHPWTKAGMDVLLYVPATYEKRHESDAANDAYERAVRIYTKLIPDAPSPELAMQVKGYLVVAYQRLSNWDKAIALLQELDQSPQANRPLVLLTLASIYQTKLSNPGKAAQYYTELLEQCPDHQFAKVAKEQRDQLLGTGSAPAPGMPSHQDPPVVPQPGVTP